MLSQITRVKSRTFPTGTPATRLTHVSTRTFLHCLTALIVNTKVLAGNVISLHLHLAKSAGQDENSKLLSRFSLELEGQAVALQYRMALLSNMPLQSQTWMGYANLWRIANLEDLPAALRQLRDNTDLLTALYESMLPAAATQSDQAASFYLLAEHLVGLNEFYWALQYSLIKQGAEQKGRPKIKSKASAAFYILPMERI